MFKEILKREEVDENVPDLQNVPGSVEEAEVENRTNTLHEQRTTLGLHGQDFLLSPVALTSIQFHCSHCGKQ